MSQRFKLGNVYVELPEGASTSIVPNPGQKVVKAEKPETPEPLEQPQYIYRPNDPFGSAIDEAHAVASITSSHKPWVKKTWFILFIIGPLFYAELGALANALQDRATEPWKSFLGYNALILPLWFLYYSIWQRKVKKNASAPEH